MPHLQNVGFVVSRGLRQRQLIPLLGVPKYEMEQERKEF